MLIIFRLQNYHHLGRRRKNQQKQGNKLKKKKKKTGEGCKTKAHRQHEPMSA
jgi:hypothetical protein